ncbi:unnamed protein product [Mytilus edulis]|uniref:Uncharacterized protein n=1 Tax=Mytilus edulis TaxID=6550 RepID=A0A8S3U5X7_MYTED|nr:unnamed protein product [Mytilus edulis]
MLSKIYSHRVSLNTCKMYHTFTAVFFLVLISVTMASSCPQCTAEGKQRTGNSSFQIKDGCWEYSCFCNCDGSWNCPTEDAREVLATFRTDLFSAQAVKMFHTLIAVLFVVLISVTTTSGCRQCTVNGQQYRGNSRFQFTNGCSRYNCMCNCDGSWNCPAEDTTNDCSGSNIGTGGYNYNCRQCQLSGQTYAGNSRFQYTDGCYRFNCDCHCDGSWTCPGSRTENIC